MLLFLKEKKELILPPVMMHMSFFQMLSGPGLLGALQEPNQSKLGIFSWAIAEVQESRCFDFARREKRQLKEGL